MQLDDQLVLKRLGPNAHLGIRIPGCFEKVTHGMRYNEFAKTFVPDESVVPVMVSVKRIKRNTFQVDYKEQYHDKVLPWLLGRCGTN
jgi:hypothetical protein